MLDRGGPFARHRDLPLGNRRQQLQEIGAVQRVHDTRRRSGTAQIDTADAGMRQRAAHQHRMQHARQHQIGDELTLAGQQAPIFTAPQRAADIGRRDVAHLRSERRRCAVLPRGAASSMSRMRPASSRWLIGFWIISLPGSSRPCCTIAFRE